MAAMGGTPLPMPGMDPAMMGASPAPPMDPMAMGMMPQASMPIPPATATPLNGAGAAPGTAVDMGGMGEPPVMAPTEDDLITNALQAVLSKWGRNPMIAGEKQALLTVLMQ